MEAGAERGLLAAIDPRVAFGGGVDVLKVPHHGSSTSSTPAFVEAVAPAHAVISVGRGNRFGLPSEEVEARWAEAGALVLRTDRDGAVEVRVRDSRLELNSAMLR